MNQRTRPGQPGNVHRLRKLTGAAAQATGREYPYTDQERAEALALVGEVGRREAARQLELSESTLADWEDKARRDLKAARAAYLASGGTLAEGEEPPSWRTQREQEANRAGLDARIVRDRATQAMLDGNWQLVKAGAAYYIALTSTAQVLTAAGGRTTSEHIRNMTPEERRQQEQDLIRAWRDRAERAGNTRAVAVFDAHLEQLEGEAS